MATSSLIGSPFAGSNTVEWSGFSPAPASPSRAARRRPTESQGRGLEILGHAIEYLVDSRQFEADSLFLITEKQAIATLAHASRSLYQECAVIVPMRQRFASWIVGAYRRV